MHAPATAKAKAGPEAMKHSKERVLITFVAICIRKERVKEAFVGNSVYANRWSQRG